ncbi:PQQ-binding-like beta-propeller repeat protein [Micavibrio aeruginosavorus]|uniref:Uncharacterized protein n=1 Tax=Micavibrio aeruginosavorus EPB TaxID=349215 RepID=M4VVX2_9BACT|nr:hypothetical protein [Micavibrio aeruginosavorus]AGH97354.1 hypothetical protein A11S_528 [Micavibrio aeruginosavorus EPB]
MSFSFFNFLRGTALMAGLAIGLWVLAAGPMAGTAAAQTPVPGLPACNLVREAIVNLKAPNFGVPVIWDGLFGDESKLMRFSAATPLPSGSVLIAGEHLNEKFQPLETFIVEMNSRGRGIGEKRIQALKGEKITALVPVDHGYVVASNILSGPADEKQVRLAWYDEARTYIRDLVLKDALYDFESYTLLPANEGNGFIAVVHARPRQGSMDEHGLLYRISATGKILWKRAYRSGAASLMHGIAPVGDTGYVVTGRELAENGRISGMAMEVNNDGTLVWQQPYPRGVHALLRKASVRPDGRVVMVGQITPFGETYSTAWVMEVDTNGEILWQRYFPLGGNETDARGVITYDDGRTVVMVNVRPRNEYADDRDHIRLLTLSPRGEILRDEPYVEGQHAQASQISLGYKSERVVIAFVEGTAGSLLPDEVVLITEQIKKQGRRTVGPDGKVVESYVAPEEPAKEQPALTPEKPPVADVGEADQEKKDDPSFRGWVFVATALDPYKDPCLPLDIPRVQDK